MLLKSYRLSKVLKKVVFVQIFDALIQLYDKWAEQTENCKLEGGLIQIDLCDYNLLVEKLKLLGIDDKATAWICS